MKTRMIMLALAVGMSVASFAKDIRTVVLTTAPQMHCENCENRIKSNIRFVKGTKQISTSLEEQKVTIVYNSKKANYDDFVAAFKKIGYEIKKK